MREEDLANAAPRRGHLDEVMRGLRWVGTARLCAQLITWTLTIFTVRLLEPRDYGVVAASGLFTEFAALLMDGGLSVLLVSRRELPTRTQGAATTGVVLLSLILAGTIVAVAPLGARLFNIGALTNVLRVASINLPLAALAVVPTALLSKGLKFRELALTRAIPGVLQGLVMLGLAMSGAGYWSLVFGTIFGNALRAAVLWISLKERPAPNVDFAALRPLWLSGGQMVGQRLVYFAAQDFDTFMLGRLGGAVALGPYSLAKTLSHTVLDQLAGVVNQVSMPAFAAKVDDERAQLTGLLLMISTVSILVFPLFWLECVLSQVALPLLFGSRWVPMIIPFMAFAFMLPFRSVYALLDFAMVGTGRVSTTFRNMLTWAAIMMPLIFIGAHFGANWAAGSWCVGFPIVLFAAMRRFADAFRVDLWRLLRPMCAPMLGSLASAIAVQVAIVTIKPYVPPASILPIGILVGSACYGLLLWHFARPHVERAWDIIRRLLRV